MTQISAGKGLDVSRIAKARRAFLIKHMPLPSAVVLEIGALDNPTFLRSEGDVFFADFFTQEESIERHMKEKSTGHTVEKIVSVDFVLRDTTLPEAVTVKPDLVIANHVIEHICNPIRWFQEVRNTCVAGTSLFLSVPDRRYTFDYFKPLTDAVDWLRAHDERVQKPTKYHILRHLFYHAAVDRAAAWRGEVPEGHLHRMSMPEAISKAETLSANYTDVHCWVFTTESFTTILGDLEETGLVPWRLQAIDDVANGDNEFRVLLEAI